MVTRSDTQSTGRPRRVLLLSPKLRWTNEELIIHSSSETHGVCCCCVCSDVFQEDLWTLEVFFELHLCSRCPLPVLIKQVGRPVVLNLVFESVLCVSTCVLCFP